MAGGIHPPIRVIESWPAPHYNDPVTRGWATVAVTVVLGVICVFMVVVRLIARAFVQHNFGIDDWVIIVAMVPTLALAIGICLATQVYNFNRHIWDVRPTGYVPARKSEFANSLLYVWAAGLIKISILLFYKRMTTGTFSKTFVYIIWACIAFVVCFIITFTFNLIFNCSPVNSYWNQVDPVWVLENSYSCANEAAGILAACSVALVQDIMAATLPLALFWSLEIPKRQKIALLAVFLIGFFLVASNAVRMYYVYRTFYATYDTTWEAYDIWLWTSIEILVAPMCASAPALKVFFRTVLQDRTWNTWSSRSRVGSKGWRRTGTGTSVEEGTERFNDVKSPEIDNSQATSQSVLEDQKRTDSPTLGNETDHGMQLDYFKSVRDSRSQQPHTSPATLQEDWARTGNFAKVEKTLGL